MLPPRGIYKLRGLIPGAASQSICILLGIKEEWVTGAVIIN